MYDITYQVYVYVNESLDIFPGERYAAVVSTVQFIR